MIEAPPISISASGHIEVGMKRKATDVAASRTEAERRAFREARGLLVAFGVGAIPATLALCLMGIDFLEGDFGISGTIVMALAGVMSPVCAIASRKARQMWDSGATLALVQRMIMWWVIPPLVGILVGMLLFATRFSFLAGM